MHIESELNTADILISCLRLRGNKAIYNNALVKNTCIKISRFYADKTYGRMFDRKQTAWICLLFSSCKDYLIHLYMYNGDYNIFFIFSTCIKRTLR